MSISSSFHFSHYPLGLSHSLAILFSLSFVQCESLFTLYRDFQVFSLGSTLYRRTNLLRSVKMARISFLAGAVCLSTFAAASPLASRDTNTTSTTCSEVHQRKAWHNLSDDEKSAYIEAELCLINSPAKDGLPYSKTRWDEITYSHAIQTNWVHDVGSFLPWHRYFMWTHEKLLRDECNYTGYQPYWEESLDSGNISASVVFDPVTGFGGEGGDCVDDGPFANLTLGLSSNGSQIWEEDYCLARSFSDTTFDYGNTTYIEECLSYSNCE